MIVIMSDALSLLFEPGDAVTLEPGQTLFHGGDPVRQVFLVTRGRMHLTRHGTAGQCAVLQRADAGDVLAEASAYSAQYHCAATAARPTRLCALPVHRFRDALRRDPALAEAWAATLARSVQAARMRAEIRGLRRVDQRLDAWLGENRHLPPKGAWQDLADELGVTREALYRELARRRG